MSAARGGEGLAQPLLVAPERLEEDRAPEQVDVVRKVEVALVVGQHEVRLGDDPGEAAVAVEDRHAGQLVVVQGAHDVLDLGVDAHRSRRAVHHVSDGVCHGAATLSERQAGGSASITSPAITWSAPRRSAAARPASPWASAPSARRLERVRAASPAAPPSGRRARRRCRPWRAPALPPGLTATRPSGLGHDRVVPLQQHDRTAQLRRAARAGEPLRLHLRGLERRAGGPARAACGVSTVGPLRSRSSSSCPACAFSPSASTSSGASTARGAAARELHRARRCGRAPGRAPPLRRARPCAARSSTPSGVCAAVLVGQARASSARAGAAPPPAAPSAGTATCT